MSMNTQDLVAFRLTGKRPVHSGDDASAVMADAVARSALRPVLFAGYSDLTSLRYDFPVVLVDGPHPATPLRSLTSVMNDVIDAWHQKGLRVNLKESNCWTWNVRFAPMRQAVTRERFRSSGRRHRRILFARQTMVNARRLSHVSIRRAIWLILMVASSIAMNRPARKSQNISGLSKLPERQSGSRNVPAR